MSCNIRNMYRIFEIIGCGETSRMPGISRRRHSREERSHDGRDHATTRPRPLVPQSDFEGGLRPRHARARVRLRRRTGILSRSGSVGMARITLLFVRRMDDVPSSVEAVAALLAFRRSHAASASLDEVAGIWVHSALGAGFPIWPPADHDPGLAIRESCGLSGVWSYAWIDGRNIRQAANADERRSTIRRTLAAISTFVVPPPLPSNGSSAEDGIFLTWPPES
jgi:hypothetical protein